MWIVPSGSWMNVIWGMNSPAMPSFHFSRIIRRVAFLRREEKMGRGMTMDNRAYLFFACLFRSHRGECERKNLHTSLPGRSYIFALPPPFANTHSSTRKWSLGSTFGRRGLTSMSERSVKGSQRSFILVVKSPLPTFLYHRLRSHNEQLICKQQLLDSKLGGCF